MPRIRTVIMGAAGRDFHNFNVVYRNDPDYEVVGFTAAQIPDIAGRRYPPELAGPHYPDGIPIFEESELAALVPRLDLRQVVFAYSDVSYAALMHKAAIAQAAGADFVLLGPTATMLEAKKPVVAVCAVRTGAGKSQTTRRLAGILRGSGKRVAVIRHPMPYGDLVAQRVQRFSTVQDLRTQQCTIEEMEEYEPHIAAGSVVFAGVDYAAILESAQAEADLILWDGGNNDFPFYRPSLHLVVADPLRLGDELAYHPGEVNLRMADVVVINKVDAAGAQAVEELRAHVRTANPSARIIEAASPVFAEDPDRAASLIEGKKVLVIEDGPTLTHGGMPFGAGTALARRLGAGELIDPRPHAVGSLRDIYATYPTLGPALPAMGYGHRQVRELEATIAAVPCDAVIVGTPIDLARVVTIRQPTVRARYDLQEVGKPDLEDVLGAFLQRAPTG